MLRGLLIYAKYLLKIIFIPERKIVTGDIRRYSFNPHPFKNIPSIPRDLRDKSLHLAIGWLEQAHDAMEDDGFGSYHLSEKWTSIYPETTGYIIPTLINYSKAWKIELDSRIAIKAARYLCTIQYESGGWQGGRIGEKHDERVFNTGQVIRGLIAAWQLTGEASFMASLTKGCDWLCSVQDEEGFWKEFALMTEARVYDSYVDAALLMAHGLTGNESYKRHAIKNLEWIIKQKMHDNGWFEDCDNTIRRNDRPILHTIAYTLDGLFDCGSMLEEERFILAARKGADILRDKFLQDGFLNGRYDQNWQGSEYLICTGAAQLAIVWLKLFEYYHEETYITAADRMIDLLVYIQDRHIDERDETKGAIPGSFPVWGRYEPFAFPNWATKFFCDALLLRNEHG